MFDGRVDVELEILVLMVFGEEYGVVLDELRGGKLFEGFGSGGIVVGLEVFVEFGKGNGIDERLLVDIGLELLVLVIVVFDMIVGLMGIVEFFVGYGGVDDFEMFDIEMVFKLLFLVVIVFKVFEGLD